MKTATRARPRPVRAVVRFVTPARWEAYVLNRPGFAETLVYVGAGNTLGAAKRLAERHVGPLRWPANRGDGAKTLRGRR